jgi:hypothetical protein
MTLIGRWLAATAILTALLVVTGSVMPAVARSPAAP